MRHRFVSSFLFAMVAAFLLPVPDGQISAQIRIRIPQPRPERKVPPPAPDPTNTSRSVAGDTGQTAKTGSNDTVQATVPAGIMIDDGYTFFRLRGKKDYVDYLSRGCQCCAYVALDRR